MILTTGKTLPSFAKSIFDEMTDNISSNASHYYAFTALMNRTSEGVEIIDSTDYNYQFTTNWKMIFGKKISNTDITPIVKNNLWITGKAYDRYDNLSANLHSNANFFVFSPPATVGSPYHVFKCIDNANGSVSTVKPNIVQDTTFETADGYKWRYLTSVSYNDYQNYSTTNYAPIYPNSSIVSTSMTNCGVEIVVVANGGSGYSTYHNGYIKSAPSDVLLQISDDAINSNDHYTDSAIYIYTEGLSSSQYAEVFKYNSNTSGKWVTLKSAVNLTNINPGVTQYRISPKVIFKTDGSTDPVAYSVVNATTNTIHSIVVTDIGSDITWANVSLQCRYGTGANLYAIVPPPGGHGSDPASELDMKGVSIHFNFANTENSTIPTNDIEYDTIGLMKNPYAANTDTYRLKSSNRYWANTFDQITKMRLPSSLTFSNSEQIVGSTSSATGKVLKYDSTYVYVIGDKYFANEETIVSASGTTFTANIVHQPDVYVKDNVPLYVQYINTINRPIENTQTESFNLLIQF